MTGWRVLAVDDEPLALDELAHLVRGDARVAEVVTARDGLEALRLVGASVFDAVFLDVNMPQLDGMELGRVLAGMAHRPVLVFVTAFETRAADAFALDAVDYVLKPLRPERIGQALNRVERRRLSAADGSDDDAPDAFATVAVDDNGRTVFVRRDDVLYAESHRDYAHLHTTGPNAGVHVVRMPLSALETSWSRHGFLRIHRSYLVALRHVTELSRDPLGGQVVRVAGHDLPVSRRQAGVLRERVQTRGHRGGAG